jgi:hypothetical protein
MHDGDDPMTCIVGLIYSGGFLMGCDSKTKMVGTTIDLATPKIFERGELLIGTSGTRRDEELLHYSLDVPKLPEPSHNGAKAREDLNALDAYMGGTFSNAVRSLFKEQGALSSGDDAQQGDYYNGAALIGVRGQIYILFGNFACSRAREFAAVGSGMDFALAALDLTRHLEPRVRVHKALETAARFAQGVGGELLIFPSESS